jgi:uncharacterized coiled-coil protein SlyX
LTLREGELDSRLRDRDRTIEELNLRLREITGSLRKEQATREMLSRQIAELQTAARPNKNRRQKKPPVTRPKRRIVDAPCLQESAEEAARQIALISVNRDRRYSAAWIIPPCLERSKGVA